ncbi:rRNA-binding ribosome biosynthesis protein rpf2 [Cyanidiococcus yangmingshanensis]|uniref:Ribosome production factor 2 homolog n=1 Tax=Cyanidiococcus yangmingshanensis TaxID=2690220 RepID=A0A7J7INP1_9RHOD|nr:rRNA-binding ribosome biosynthesis protein rpf2 [Cyanidiococcus yangmingshanensis]
MITNSSSASRFPRSSSWRSFRQRRTGALVSGAALPSTRSRRRTFETVSLQSNRYAFATVTMESKHKGRTKAGKRALERRAPKLEENPKRLLVLRASKTSQTAVDGVRALACMKKPLVTVLNKRNEIRPFEVGGEASLEFLLQKSDCSLFVLATHQKKRPHGLILGRSYDSRVLDMIEVGIESLETKDQVRAAVKPMASVGTKPCLCFLGDAWSAEPHGQRLRNFFLDFFRAYDLSAVNLAGIDRAIVLVAVAMPETAFDTDRLEHVRQPSDSSSSLYTAFEAAT